ncbi:MAG: T9SS type A sorting domain-containing protein [Saprospirales bacterium]|nr:T9SS type A sorting domain-containing protein [Saprospirales bacterium]
MQTPLYRQLTDLTGKTVWFQDGLVQAGEQSVRLELNTLPAGLYVFNLVHRDQVYSQKVVVTR